ncbi:MAG TPA: hypothetical protein VK666_21525 [Chryseolinea sp.]|nr:hypothetical protein [Chryseolinea sp.]
MLIRKNTKAFKTIQEIINTCKDRPDREKLIRLYITRAGHTIKDRISVEGIQDDANFFYAMNYDAVLNNLASSDRQLNQSEDSPGIYFFHSTSNKTWDETPFEFDESIEKEFSSLSDLPIVRKKEKAEKFVFPVATSKSKPEARHVKKEKVEPAKPTKVVETGPRQPNYHLKHKTQFTNLDKVVFRNPKLSKKDVLDYYSKIAEYILPHLKDRPLSIRLNAKDGRSTEYKTLRGLPGNVEIPEWIQTTASSRKEEVPILCSDKGHLLFYTEIGAVQFDRCHSRTKSLEFSDYIVVEVESPEAILGKAIDVTLAAREILSGLNLPSCVVTYGTSVLHLYVPLDARSKFETGKAVAEYLCKLIRLKIPQLVALDGSDDHSYGKVSLSYLANEEGKSLVAPYSLAAGESALVATPLQWEELNEALRPEDFNHETIFKRLKRLGDPIESQLKKKVNADSLLDRLEKNYSFIF